MLNVKNRSVVMDVFVYSRSTSPVIKMRNYSVLILVMAVVSILLPDITVTRRQSVAGQSFNTEIYKPYLLPV